MYWNSFCVQFLLSQEYHNCWHLCMKSMNKYTIVVFPCAFFKNNILITNNISYVNTDCFESWYQPWLDVLHINTLTFDWIGTPNRQHFTWIWMEQLHQSYVGPKPPPGLVIKRLRPAKHFAHVNLLCWCGTLELSMYYTDVMVNTLVLTSVSVFWPSNVMLVLELQIYLL